MTPLLIAWLACGLAAARFTYLTANEWDRYEHGEYADRSYGWWYVPMALPMGPVAIAATMLTFHSRHWRLR